MLEENLHNPDFREMSDKLLRHQSQRFGHRHYFSSLVSKFTIGVLPSVTITLALGEAESF